MTTADFDQIREALAACLNDEEPWEAEALVALLEKVAPALDSLQAENERLTKENLHAEDMLNDKQAENERLRAVVEAAQTLFPPDAAMWNAPRLADLRAALAALDPKEAGE